MSVERVLVDCPNCLNLNRAARRVCLKVRDSCNGTGKVWKNLPRA